MIRVVRAFKLVTRSGSEYEPNRRYFDRAIADQAAKESNAALGMSDAWLHPVSCFLLQVQGERGEPMHFDLDSPVEIEK